MAALAPRGSRILSIQESSLRGAREVPYPCVSPGAREWRRLMTLNGESFVAGSTLDRSGGASTVQAPPLLLEGLVQERPSWMYAPEQGAPVATAAQP